ncbi:hypothetical protein [Methylobacterium sp. V23]|uniref:hypothetical protein n=1 Tax=Methylobacterium sp. V23 TaxID=2044878 RepID=UPI000CDAB069|nr:hypothetical protein [Methylobacterium sp. V23]POR42369.1 hypothetical protein CRT23_12925 [Methylobacterium sp. V23]
MIDDVRDVLRRREALLVHFNTPMSRHESGYPRDLHDALANLQWEMCYSTVVSTDVGPTHLADPSKAAACGSVGIVVDLQPLSQIITVHSSDAGSNGRDGSSGMGSVASVATCEQSMMGRAGGHNEWYLSHPRSLGIFSFTGPAVFVPGNGELPYGLDAVAGDFPGERIFTVFQGQFHELDRNTWRWLPRSYSEIVPR